MSMIRKAHNALSQVLCLVLALALAAGPEGCRNPAESKLPPTAIAPPGTPMPMLPKGDLYADENVASADTPIEPGDSMEVTIRRGAGEERFTSVVRDNGTATVGFVEVDVRGVTAAQAEGRIQEKMAPFMRNPQVQVQLKKRTARVKRVYVFGDVKKPGFLPMARNMTVMQAIAAAENYNETAILDEIRVIRATPDRPEVLTADISRLFTYGDWSRNLQLQENDVVFVPRTRLGDTSQAANVLFPIVLLTIYPLFAASVTGAFK